MYNAAMGERPGSAKEALGAAQQSRRWLPQGGDMGAATWRMSWSSSGEWVRKGRCSLPWMGVFFDILPFTATSDIFYQYHYDQFIIYNYFIFLALL